MSVVFASAVALCLRLRLLVVDFCGWFLWLINQVCCFVVFGGFACCRYVVACGWFGSFGIASP